MMDFKNIFNQAKKELGLADHIFSFTLPIVKDKHVTLNVLNHLDRCIRLAAKAYVLKQRELKRIRILPKSDELYKRIFFEEFLKELNITTSEKHIVNEISLIVEAHKKSQMEIKRGEEYIIVLPNFEIVTINEKSIKRYINIVRSFINKIETNLDDTNVANRCADSSSS